MEVVEIINRFLFKEWHAVTSLFDYIHVTYAHCKNVGWFSLFRIFSFHYEFYRAIIIITIVEHLLFQALFYDLTIRDLLI